MQMENFWNDKRVAEMIHYHVFEANKESTIKEDIESFKKKKQQATKDYEIVAYWDVELITDIEKHKIISFGHPKWTIAVIKDFPIYSVKRLSDGSVFSIGDVCDASGYVFGVNLEEFLIRDQRMFVYGKMRGAPFGLDIKYLIKKRSPLFVTHDGVEVTENDRPWYVNDKFELVGSADLKNNKKYHPAAEYKYFSTEQKAIEYILENNSCLSVMEVEGILASVSESVTYHHVPSERYKERLTEQLKELAKSKIDNNGK